jgi:hypothetical protein
LCRLTRRNIPGRVMGREQVWLWMASGLAIILVAGALALWALYGPLVFVNALNAAWTCL